MTLALAVAVKNINIVMESLLNELSPRLKKEFTWILKDKYNLNPLEISKIFLKEGSLSVSQKKDLKRLIKGEPVNYIIGWVDFLSCYIDLSYKPLIPRPETEYWVKKVIDKYKGKKVKVLDLGCGSGCIGISVLKHLANSEVDFVDIDNSFLLQTKKNLKLNKIKKDRFRLFLSDGFLNLPKEFEYDLILTNPPYVSPKFKNKDLNWEPKVALYTKDNGLLVIKNIIYYAKSYLKPHGHVYMEFDGSNLEQKKSIESLLKKAGYSYSFYKDQNQLFRYVSFY